MRSAEHTTQNKFHNSELHNTYSNEKGASFKASSFSFFENLNLFGGLFEQKSKLWSSKRYVEAALLNKNRLTETRPQIVRELQPDLKTFFDEYAAFAPVVTYEYGLNGLQHGYSQSMTQIAQHHLQEQSLKGLPTERAQMEVNVAQSIEEWMKTPELPLGSKIMSISPRGSRADGYPGQNKKNYIFINIFEKTATGFLFQQYRSYDTLNQSAQLQQSVIEQLGGSLRYASPNQQQRKELHTIASLIMIQPEITIKDIEPLLYAHKADWAVNIDTQLPKLDGTAYPTIAAQAVDFCLDQFIEMTNDSEFSESSIERYTLLVNTVKESLIKWVETHATNYDSSQGAHTMDFSQILVVWKTRCDEADGAKLSSDQKNMLEEFKKVTALDPTLPLKSLSNWAHCIVGSPASLLKLQNVDLMNAMQANQLTQSQLIDLIGTDRAALWHEGTCVRCGDGCLVGECSICMRCELELGGQLPEDMISSSQAKFLDTLSGNEKQEGKKLFDTLYNLAVRKTVSFEQLIHQDFINPGVVDEELEPFLDRLFYASNGLDELRKIVDELSSKNNTNEHKKNGGRFVMPQQEPENKVKQAA